MMNDLKNVKDRFIPDSRKVHVRKLWAAN
jgi:hypothetical protein